MRTCWTRRGCLLVFPFHFNFIHILFLTLSSDIDECRDGTHQCRYNQICENTRGSYHCTCPRGYRSQGVGRPCVGMCRRENKPPQICHKGLHLQRWYLCVGILNSAEDIVAPFTACQAVKNMQKRWLRCCSLMLLISLSASGRPLFTLCVLFTRSRLKVCRHLFMQL